MYDIVKNVVMPAIASVRTLGFDESTEFISLDNRVAEVRSSLSPEVSGRQSVGEDLVQPKRTIHENTRSYTKVREC